MEIIDGALDLVPILSATAGVWLAAATYWIWLWVRRRLWGLDRTIVVEPPGGDEFSLVVPMLQFRTPLSRRFFRVQQDEPGQPPESNRDHRLHPMKLLESTGEMLILAVVPILVGVVILVFVLVLELVIGVLWFGLAWVAGALIRHKWTCMISRADGV